MEEATNGTIESSVSDLNDDQKESSVKETTLAEQGAKLPLGMADSTGTYQGNIELRRWNFKINRELKKKQGQDRNMTLFRYAAVVLGTMCKQLGPYKFEGMEEPARVASVLQMYMGDVLYAYCYLRKESMGKDLDLNTTCPVCGNKFVWSADLDTLPVRIANSVDELCWEYQLLEPINIRGDEIKSFGVGPVRWADIESVDPGDESTQELAVLLGAIHSIDGREVRLTENDLDELGKRDLEEILAKIATSSLGPDMAVEVTCPIKICKANWRIMIDWTYDSFFGVSSR